jgi:hypothetical protein
MHNAATSQGSSVLRRYGSAKLAAAALLLFLTGGPAVIANPDSRGGAPVFSPEPEAQAPAPQHQAQPRTQLTRPRPRRTAPAAAAAAAPAVQPTFFVAILGDNLAPWLAQGLQDALSDKPEIGLLRRFKESSGLVRDDYYDWSKATSDLLGGKDKIDMAIMFVGSNDGQAIKDASGSYEIRSDKWKEIYAKRIDAIASQFKDKHVPLLWVGLPVMRSEKLSADVAYINDIYRDEVAKFGATYVDSWNGFVDEDGQYADYGPDFSGQRARLRASDGIHFTKAGARKLASFVENDIRQAFDNAKPPVDLAAIVSGQTPGPTADLPPEPTVDINTLIQRELGKGGPPAPGSDTPGMQASLPPSDVPPAPVVPPKPAAGPIIPLTTVPTSPGGELASTAQVATSTLGSDAATLIERTLVKGEPPDAKPGRADDFAWPRR